MVFYRLNVSRLQKHFRVFSCFSWFQKPRIPPCLRSSEKPHYVCSVFRRRPQREHLNRFTYCLRLTRSTEDKGALCKQLLQTPIKNTKVTDYHRWLPVEIYGARGGIWTGCEVPEICVGLLTLPWKLLKRYWDNQCAYEGALRLSLRRREVHEQSRHAPLAYYNYGF